MLSRDFIFKLCPGAIKMTRKERNTGLSLTEYVLATLGDRVTCGAKLDEPIKSWRMCLESQETIIGPP
jgi:hypothetical protein